MTSEQSRERDASAPAVTVIIPAFGVNAYIREAVESVLVQSYRDHEVVVVNDGAPPDETAELKAILSRYGGRVGYLERANGGQGAARNTAMRASRSEFVAFLDGDDCWAPTFLERQMELMDADPSLALVYMDARIFGETVAAGSTYMESDPSVGEVTLESLLGGRCNVAMSTIVARRRMLIDAGWFDESLRYSEDFDLWFRVAHRGMRIAYRSEALAYRRVRGDALSANDIKLNAVALQVLERFAREHDLTSAERAACNSSMARLRADIALAEAKRRLVGHEYSSASQWLRDVEPEFANWKIRWAKVGLRTLPTTVRLAYIMLQRAYRMRMERHVARLRRLEEKAIEDSRRRGAAAGLEPPPDDPSAEDLPPASSR